MAVDENLVPQSDNANEGLDGRHVEAVMVGVIPQADVKVGESFLPPKMGHKVFSHIENVGNPSGTQGIRIACVSAVANPYLVCDLVHGSRAALTMLQSMNGRSDGFPFFRGAPNAASSMYSWA